MTIQWPGWSWKECKSLEEHKCKTKPRSSKLGICVQDYSSWVSLNKQLKPQTTTLTQKPNSVTQLWVFSTSKDAQCTLLQHSPFVTENLLFILKLWTGTHSQGSIPFHRERVTSPCSLTGYHHSNVLCTSDCISMHTYMHGRAGNTLECNRVQAINPDVHRFVLQHYNCSNVRLWPAHTLNACQKTCIN